MEMEYAKAIFAYVAKIAPFKNFEEEKILPEEQLKKKDSKASKEHEWQSWYRLNVQNYYDELNHIETFENYV